MGHKYSTQQAAFVAAKFGSTAFLRGLRGKGELDNGVYCGFHAVRYHSANEAIEGFHGGSIIPITYDVDGCFHILAMCHAELTPSFEHEIAELWTVSEDAFRKFLLTKTLSHCCLEYK